MNDSATEWQWICNTDDALADLFSPIGGASEDGPDSVMLYLCYRHDHVPVLHIRDAR